MKKVYGAVDEETALYELEQFGKKWDSKYQKISQSWRSHWSELSTYFKYPQSVRTLIYTTNAIENFNLQLRKVTKNKAAFLNDDALLKMLYLTQSDITRKWTGRRRAYGSGIAACCCVLFSGAAHRTGCLRFNRRQSNHMVGCAG